MFRQIACFALLIAVSGTLLVRTAAAQTTAKRTLSQRLEQFRDDLLGETISDDDDPDFDSRPAVVQKPTPAQTPTQAQTPTPARGAPKTGAAKSAEPTPTLARTPASSGDGEKKAPTKAGGSSRRTAQPGYKPGKSQPTPVEVEEDTPQPEPTLAKPPAAPRSEASEPSTPRLARSTQLDLALPARQDPQPRPQPKLQAQPEPQPQAKTPERPKSNPARETDVLFSGQSPQLSVEASGPHKVLIGKPATFTVKLRNAGDVAANNVVVTVNIPPFAEVAEAQPSTGHTRAASGTEHHEPFEWKITRLDAHNRETLTLKIIPRKSIPIDLAVQWTCSPEVSQTLVEVQEPKLAMALSGPAEVHFGQTKIYKLTISNPGNGDAENVNVSLLPIGRGAEGAASHKIGLLKAGQSKSIEVELTARHAGALTIRAQAYADGGLRAEAAEPVLVRRANLKIDVEGPKIKYAGTSGTYRIHVTNSGDATAENVQISAILPPQAKYLTSNGAGRAEVDRGKVVWTAANVQPGGERLFEVHCTLLSPGDNRVQVIATGDDELSASAAANTHVEALADLKLEIRDPQGPIPLGEDAVFEVIVRNRGTKSAENIDLVVFFSEGLEATSVQGGAHEIGRGQVSFKTIPILAAGSETVLRVHARADRPANHVFRAELVCESLQTKLAAEETTRFYGDDDGQQPTKASHHGEDRLQPVPNE